MLTAAFADLPLPLILTWVVPVIGVVAAGLTFLVGRAISKGRKTRTGGESPGGAGSSVRGGGASDPFIFGSNSERRSGARREGNTVEVILADRDERAAPLQGWVVDRSVGGLGLRTEVPLPVGAVFSVRPRSASAIVPWTEVEVKSCRQHAATWEVGCQFVRTPPWSVLLLFG
jgi:hypothetical protein